MAGSYTSTSYTGQSYTLDPLPTPPPNRVTLLGGLSAVYIAGKQVNVNDYEITKMGERGTDIATLKVSYGAQVAMNDSVQFVIDIVNMVYLVGAYFFEYHSSDGSGRAHDMTVSNTSYGAGYHGKGLVFNGSTSYATIQDHPDYAFTGMCELNFRVKATGTNTYIIQKRTATNNGWSFKIDGTGKCVFQALTNSITSSVSINDGLWHWVRIKRDENGLITLFIDNVSSGTPVTQSADLSVSAQILLGKNFDGTGFLNGTIDSLRIYKDGYLTKGEAGILFNNVNMRKTLKLGGKVWNISDDVHPITIQVKSYGKELGEIEIKATSVNVFSNATPESIIQSLIAGNTGLQFIDISSTSSTTVISRFVAEGKLIDLVSALASGVGKVFYTDGFGHFFLADLGADYTSLVFRHGLGCNIKNITKDDVELINDLTLIGAQIRYTQTETFNGNGSNKIFTLAENPLSTKVTVNGAIKKAELDYTVDIELRIITMITAPPTGTNNVVVDYTYEAPIIVRGQKKSSVTLYGRRDKKITLPWIRTYADGVRFVQNYLALQSSIMPVYSIEVSKLVAEVDENIVVQLIDANTFRPINDGFTIKQIKYLFRQSKTIIQVGQFKHDNYDLQAQIQEKLHQIESIVSTTNKVRDYKALDETLNMLVTAHAKIAPDESPTETLTVTDSANAYRLLNGYDVATYDSRSAYDS